MEAKQIFKVDSTAGIVRVVVIGAIGIIGLALAIKMVRNRVKNQSSNRLVDDDNVRIATELQSAIHPGRNWFTDLFVYADKDKLFQLAPELKNFDDVSKEYQNLYRESLTLELQDALGEEYPSFVAKLQAVKTGSSALPTIDVTNLAQSLRNEIEGVNWTSRDLTPFSAMLRLSDADFKRVIETYNSKFSPDNFRKDLEGESGMSVLFPGMSVLFPGTGMDEMTFDQLKEKIMVRCKLLNV